MNFPEIPLKETLMPSDLRGIDYRSTQLEGLEDKTNKIRAALKVDDDSCFTKSGKVKSTQTCALQFNEECSGRLKSITDRIESALSATKCMREKHRRMYPAVKQAPMSRKRRQKENKAKSKKRKHDCYEKKTAKGSKS